MSAEPPAGIGAHKARAAMMVLNQAFDANTLALVRAVARAYAIAAGIPERRAGDVMLAVHELAANAVFHGGGAGQLNLWRTPGQLWCQIEDDGAGTTSHDHQASETGDPSALWPYQTGHGLWIAQLVASQMHATTGPTGTRVTVTFTLPSTPR